SGQRPRCWPSCERKKHMTSKSKLMIGIALAAISGMAFTTAFANDYAATPVRYDDQAEQTRQLNQAALEHARDQNDTNSQQSNDDADDDSDNDAAMMPGDDGRDS